MGPNQNPVIPNQNPLTPNQSPYATPSTPSNLGVRPAAQLSAAFLTQAFAWMFVGLLLTAGVAYCRPEQPAPARVRRRVDVPARSSPSSAWSFAIAGAINRISATVALGLFFVYAASVGLTIGLIVSYLHRRPRSPRRSCPRRRCSVAAAIYGAVTKRSLAGLGGILFMGLIGLIVAIGDQHLPRLRTAQLPHLDRRRRASSRRSPPTTSSASRAATSQPRLGSMEKAAVIGALVAVPRLHQPVPVLPAPLRLAQLARTVPCEPHGGPPGPPFCIPDGVTVRRAARHPNG